MICLVCSSPDCHPGTEVLSGKLNDSIPELSVAATSFLEAVGVINAEKHSNNIDNAEKHFQAVHEFWTNKYFVPLFHQVIDDEYFQLLPLANGYGSHTSFALQQSRVEFIKKDPSLKDILNHTDPSVRLRGAISILIRYWCVDNMMEEYFFKNFGLYALGLDISYAAAAQELTPLNSEGEKEMFFGLPEKRAAGPTASAPESKRSRPITMPLNYFSPIGQLVNVPSIKHLAQDVEHHPELLDLARQLLEYLKDVHYDDKPVFRRNSPFLIHCEAMWDFWRNQNFRVLMRVHLLEDPHLLVMVKMFSDQLKREITVDRLQHIQITLLPKLQKFLKFFDLEKPAEKIRCAFSIMMRYWGCLGVAMRLREKSGIRPEAIDGKPLIKYSDNFKDEQIGEIVYYPVQKDADCNFMLTQLYAANETEINLLLDKEWRDVLTGRCCWSVEAWSLLGEIDLDTHLNLVMKKDNDGKLCMTCTKRTQVACST